MNWVDVAIIGVLVISAAVGLARGLIREALSLVVWIAALLVGWLFADDVAQLLAAQVSHRTMAMGIAFAILVALVLLIGAIVGALLSAVIHQAGLVGFDRGLGLAFGLARGGVLVAMAVFLASLTPLPEEVGWQGSALIGRFEPAAQWLFSMVPKDVQVQLKRI